MSPIDTTSINEKLFKLERAAEIVEEVREKGEKKFFADDITQGAAMFNLLVSIELIVDIGNHILSEMFQPAKNYKDTILLLGKHKVIPESYAKENANMGDFRNKLVHDYSSIDPKKVYAYLQKAPDIFRQFAKYFVEFMEKHDTDISSPK